MQEQTIDHPELRSPASQTSVVDISALIASRIALNIDEAAMALGVTRRVIEGMIDRGELRAKLCGRRLLIGVDQLRRYFQ